MDENSRSANLVHVFLIAASWFAITELVPHLSRLLHVQPQALSLVYAMAGLRMLLMFLVTYLYVRLYEKSDFIRGFQFSLRKFWAALFWAYVFSVVDIGVIWAYQSFIVTPLSRGAVEASRAAGGEAEALAPLFDRVVIFAYVVLEGVVEVFIFISFLFDRLLRRWGWPAALLVSNAIFGLWHYSYWNKGALEGSLMIVLTFISGSIVSLNYLKTRNSLSSALCHTLVDLPSSIREFLGIM